MAAEKDVIKSFTLCVNLSNTVCGNLFRLCRYGIQVKHRTFDKAEQLLCSPGCLLFLIQLLPSGHEQTNAQAEAGGSYSISTNKTPLKWNLVKYTVSFSLNLDGCIQLWAIPWSLIIAKSPLKLSSSNLHCQNFSQILSHSFLRSWLRWELAWGDIWMWSLLIRWEVNITVSHEVNSSHQPDFLRTYTAVPSPHIFIYVHIKISICQSPAL